MEKSSALFEQIKNELSYSFEFPQHFFEKIKTEYSKQERVEIYNYIFEQCQDIVILSHALKEIDALREKNNLDTLLDFLLTKTKESFQFSNSQINDFINLRVKILSVIANYKDTKAVPALLYCLNSKNEHYKFRLAAAEALGKIGDTNAVESLINVVKDEEEKSVYVRESAAKALGMIGDSRALESFLEILEAKKSFLDKFTFLKERVIEAIGKLDFSHSKRVLAALKNALMDDSPQLRLNAIESLSSSDYDEAPELIEGMLYDSNEDVAMGAVIALYNMFGKDVLYDVLKKENLAPCVVKQVQEWLDEEEDE